MSPYVSICHDMSPYVTIPQGEEKTSEMLDNMKEVGFGWVSCSQIIWSSLRSPQSPRESDHKDDTE